MIDKQKALKSKEKTDANPMQKREACLSRQFVTFIPKLYLYNITPSQYTG